MLPNASVERLRLLSLALDEALSRDDLDEAFALLSSRDECIAAMQRDQVVIPPAELRELVALNDRLTVRLRASQSHVVDTLRTRAKASQVARAYSS